MGKESQRAQFDRLSDPADCPMCRTCGTPTLFGNPLNVFIHDFGDSVLYLHANQYWRGYCLLVSKHHVRELFELSSDQLNHLVQALAASERAIWLACDPDKMNVKSVGNVVSHLHWHIQPRYWDSPEGLKAMTNADAPKRPLSLTEAAELANAIRRSLHSSGGGLPPSGASL